MKTVSTYLPGINNAIPPGYGKTLTTNESGNNLFS